MEWRGSRMECAGSHTPCILDLLMDSKELSSISDCFGDKKAIKTPKLNTIWLELNARVLNMLIGLKSDNYYSKVFKRVNYKLWNSTFWVVISFAAAKWGLGSEMKDFKVWRFRNHFAPAKWVYGAAKWHSCAKGSLRSCENFRRGR